MTIYIINKSVVMCRTIRFKIVLERRWLLLLQYSVFMPTEAFAPVHIGQLSVPSHGVHN